jgi:transcriptional regulator with XRE-family HTH domain
VAPRRRTLTEAFGDALRVQRLDAGYSQEAFAHECSLHRTYISQLERGLKSPSLSTLELIAGALEMKPHQLVKAAEDRL